MHASRGTSAAARAVTLSVAALVALLVVAPLARLAALAIAEVRSAPGGAWSGLAALLSDPGLAAAVRNSLVLAVGVTVLAVPVGAALALLLRRPDVPLRGLWQAAMLLPLLVPDFVLGYSWTTAYGPAGLTASLTGVAWGGLLGPAGVLVVLAVDSVPLVFLVVSAGLAARAEPDLERAAAVAGARPATVLRTVTLPLAGPALAASTVLVLVLSLGAFAIPLVLGSPAGFRTVTTQLYADLARSGDPQSFVRAVTLAVLLVVLAAVVVLPADTLLGPRLRASRARGNPAGPTPGRRRGAGPWVAVGTGVYVGCTVLVPLLALVQAAVTRAVGGPSSPATWTLDNFRAVLGPRTLEALGRSLVLSLVAATVLTVMGALVALAERRRSGRALSVLVTLTLVLPGSALAVALLVGYGRWLADTAALIVLAYLAKLWAFAHRPVSGALDRLAPDELQAARVSGASLPGALRTVVLPPLLPALAVAWVACFVTGLHEVTMSSLLYGPGSETLAVVVLATEELGSVGPTAALSALLTLLVAVPAATAWWGGRLAVRGVRRAR